MSAPSYSPGRPPSIRDVELVLNGDLVFLGVLVSTGAAVNNATTATPFYAAPQPGTASMAGTLAGKCLLLQPTAAGHVLASNSASISVPSVTTVATFATVPPAAATAPGPKLQAEERINFIMLPTNGWLQWLPSTGSANLFVWEIV